MSSNLTTIKVTKPVRERIARASRAQKLPANEFLDELITQWERNQRMEAVGLAMRNASTGDLNSYVEESVAWASTDSDGLES